MYFDLEKKARMCKELGKTLLQLLDKSSQNKFTDTAAAKEWLDGEAGMYKPLLRILTLKGKVWLEILDMALAVKEKHLGIFMVLNSNPNADKTATLQDYRSRDSIEKLFNTLKNMTGNKRLRAASDESAEGRVFIAFVATILHDLMQERLRAGKLLGKYSVREALEMLRKVKTAIVPGQTAIKLEIQKKVRELLRGIGLEKVICAGNRWVMDMGFLIV